MPGEVQVRKGAILLWRLGNLDFGEQSRWSRAPESRGMWAFPYPYFDLFFAVHQYNDRLPKRLQYYPHSYSPLAAEWYQVIDARGTVIRDLNSSDRLMWPEPNERGHVMPPSGMDAEGNELELDVREGLYEAKNEWINKVGRKILPIRKFWYHGDLYSHIRENGEIGNPGTFGDTDWFRIHSTTFGEVIRKTRGTRWHERTDNGLAPLNSAMDHLEVFIPPRAGTISSPRDLRQR